MTSFECLMYITTAIAAFIAFCWFRVLLSRDEREQELLDEERAAEKRRDD